jgi:hypothetical protein
MRRVLFAILTAVLLAIPSTGAAPVSGASCQFVLGFKALHDQIPGIVGECKTDEYHNSSNGDAIQETTGLHGGGGLLVWRKCDNVTAFTDGQSTWLMGPGGLQRRLNAERFPWEHDCPAQQAAPSAAQQPQSRQMYYWHPHLIQTTANCDNTFIHGQVKAANGTLLNGIAVKTWNDWGTEEISLSGTNAWMDGNWIRRLNRDNNPQKWYAAVVDGAGHQASETAVMEFQADCNVGPQVVEINFYPD